MEIKDLKPNSGNADVVGQIVQKEAPRTFTKFGKSGKVCNAKLKDASGQIVLTLWNDDAEKVNEGDTVHIVNGWCSEYKGEKQLSTGKFGKIELVEQKGDAPAVYTNDPAILGMAPSGEKDVSDEGDDEGDETDAAAEEEFIE